jgi:hypothetical protein
MANEIKIQESDTLSIWESGKELVIQKIKSLNYELHELQTKSAFEFDKSDHKRIVNIHKKLSECEFILERINYRLDSK